MDVIPLAFDMPSNKGIETKRTKTVIIKTFGHEKSHDTLVLSWCAVGTKLLYFLISKRQTLTMEKLPNGIYVHLHTKGRLDVGRMKKKE